MVAVASREHLLEAETAAARSELARLRRDLARVQDQLGGLDVSRMLQVNEQLVLAAGRAEEIANAAAADVQRLRRAAANRQGVLRDANEQLVLQALDARELEAKAEEAHRRQVLFLATVAHELRNPLSPIRTAAQLLGRTGGDPEALARLQGIIERQVAHMARLVEDLLDGARGDAGTFRIERRDVDLQRVLAQALEASLPLLQERNQRLQEQRPAMPIWVSGDSTRLAQVFCNLLDNASKYTPRGGELRLSVRVAEGNVTVSVADNGIGIHPDALDHVFDLFVREPRAFDLDKAGLGIGLSVVRSLVEAHGGTIVAHSAGVDRGSEFVITLPLLPAATT